MDISRPICRVWIRISSEAKLLLESLTGGYVLLCPSWNSMRWITSWDKELQCKGNNILFADSVIGLLKLLQVFFKYIKNGRVYFTYGQIRQNVTTIISVNVSWFTVVARDANVPFPVLTFLPLFPQLEGRKRQPLIASNSSDSLLHSRSNWWVTWLG